MPMKSMMMSLDTGRKKCTIKQDVLKSRSWPWRQNVVSWFLKTQGSVATDLRFGGIYSNSVITIFSWFWQRKNFENQLLFAEII